MNERIRIVFTQRALTYLVLTYCVASAVSLFLSSYFNYNLTESMIFAVNDGWCNPVADGIGEHCFGDFFVFMSGDYDNAWTQGKSAYSALGVLYFLPFKLFIAYIGTPKIALFVHLSILLFCLVFPVLHMNLIKRIKKGTENIVISLAMLLSAPALMAIDRGNNIVICVPFLYLFFLKTLEKKKSAKIYGLILISLRPQFALFLLFPLFRKKWKETLTWIFSSITAYLILFSLFGLKNMKINIESWVQNLTNYQSTVPLPMFFPSNWSFANVASLFASGVNSIFKGGFLTPNDNFQVDPQIARILPIIFLAVVFLVMYLKKSRIGDFEFITLLTILILLVPGVTFSYYLVLLLVPILFVYLAESPMLNIEKYGSSLDTQFHENIFKLVKSKTKRFAFRLILFSILIPWSLPWLLIGINRELPYALISMTWTFSAFALFFWFCSILFSNGEKNENRIGNYSGIQ